MEQTKRKNGILSRLYRLGPKRHWLLLISSLLVLLHLLTRSNYPLNRTLSEHFVRPIHRFLSQLNARVPFSVAEVLIGLAALAVLIALIRFVILLILRKQRLLRLYITVITLAGFAMTVYAGFCLLWGVYYYGDDFAARSGLDAQPVSVQDLSAVTAYFADRCNEYSDQVPRNAKGAYIGDRQAILDRSPELYEQIQNVYPCLEGPPLRTKAVVFSRVMSYVDFTGFFFPFTAEANVNTDFPPSLFASTVAHEQAHQRGVAKEQEANFVAVIASLENGDPDYCYSSSLLAYIHLSNALYSVDRAAWQRIYRCLKPEILTDLQLNRSYWKQFETPVQTVSNAVYENFLYSYDQDLGLKSYGACVDLLVNYYIDKAYGH